jgi:hypothetical protein
VASRVAPLNRGALIAPQPSPSIRVPVFGKASIAKGFCVSQMSDQEIAIKTFGSVLEHGAAPLSRRLADFAAVA